MTEEVVKDVNYLDFKNTFTYNTASSRIKFVFKDYRWHQGYSFDYQMKFLKYICYQEKRGTDETYDISQNFIHQCCCRLSEMML